MNDRVFNIAINSTISLGEKIIFDTFDSSTLDKYVEEVKKIASLGFEICRDKVQLKTCINMLNAKPDDYKLTRLQIFFVPNLYSHGILRRYVGCKNTEENICKRYVLEMNKALPILIQKR